MNIVLVGFRCSGKSSVGQILAGELGMDFLDTDAVIMEDEGCSMPKIGEVK
jgi:shikimate kinase